MFNKSFSKAEGLSLSHHACIELLNIVDSLCSENNIEYWIDGGTLLGAVRHKGFIPWDDDLDICLSKDNYDRLVLLLKEYCNQSPDHVLYFSDANFPYWCESFGNINYLIDGMLPVRIDLLPMKFVKNTPEAIAFDKSITNVAITYVRGKPKNEGAILDIHKKYLPQGKDPIKEKEAFFKIFDEYMAEGQQNAQYPEECVLNYPFNDVYVKHEREYYPYLDVFPISTIGFEGQEFCSPNNPGSYLTILYGDKYMEMPPEELRTTHFSKFYQNDLPKKEVKSLLDKLHHYGFINLALGKKNREKAQKKMQIRSFLILFFPLVLQFKFKSAINLIRYSRIRMKK